MASARDIKAGRAAVEIIAETDPLKRTLAQGAGILRQWGSNLSNISGLLSGIGAGLSLSSVVASVNDAVKVFAEAGSALNDMSARTGVSTAELQHMGFAAQQTGASLDDVERALRTMAKNGMNVREFESVGRRIAAIPDPSLRAAQALETFGKSGTKLLPMFASYRELKASSLALGPAITAEEVKRADELGDAFDALAEAQKRAKAQVGDSLAPSYKAFTEILTGVNIELAEFIKKNKQISEDKAFSFGSGPFGVLLGMMRLRGKAAASGVSKDAAVQAEMAEGDSSEKQFKDDLKEVAKANKDVLDAMTRAADARKSLIQSFETPAERFLRRQREITDAIQSAMRQGSFMGMEQAARQVEQLKTAWMRLREEESKRLRDELSDRMKHLPKQAAKQAGFIATSSRGSFSAAGAAMLGRSGDAIERDQLTEQKNTNRKLDGIHTTLKTMRPRFT